MRLNTEHRRVERSDEPSAATQFGISQGDEAHLMTVLRDTLYSDKILAVLREYTSNAWDEHRQSGKADVPIAVTLPCPQHPTLHVRDFGRGLSKEAVLGVFSLYGASTKRNDDTAVGCMGIGSKAAFAYTDSFTVISRFEGVRYTYICSIDTSERGTIELVDEAATAEPTGLEIVVAVRVSDCAEFELKARDLLSAMSPQPYLQRHTGEQLSLASLQFGIDTKATAWTAIMGCVPYPISLPHLRGLNALAARCGGVIEFSVGEVAIAASREALRYTDATVKTVSGRINDACDAWVGKALQQWEAASSDFAKRVALAEMPLLANLAAVKPWRGDIDLAPLRSKLHNINIRRNKKGRFVDHDELALHHKTRILIRDDKRAMTGFALSEYDHIVRLRDGQTIDGVVAAIEQHLANVKASGCPVLLTSRLAWIAQPRAPRQAPSPRPVKASMYQLKPQYRFSDTMSSNWDGVEREATKADIFVILDRFKPIGVSYDEMQADFETLRAFGLTAPEVFGYKRADAAEKVVGVAYSDWRKGLNELVRRESQLARDLIAAYALHWVAQWHGDEDRACLALGADHVLTSLLRDAAKAHRTMMAISYRLTNTVDRLCTNADKQQHQQRLDDVYAKYPLLKHNSSKLSVLSCEGEALQAWINYIKQQDLLMCAVVSEVGNAPRKVNGHNHV